MTAMEHAHTYIDPAMENVLKEGRSVMVIATPNQIMKTIITLVKALENA